MCIWTKMAQDTYKAVMLGKIEFSKKVEIPAWAKIPT